MSSSRLFEPPYPSAISSMRLWKVLPSDFPLGFIPGSQLKCGWWSNNMADSRFFSQTRFRTMSHKPQSQRNMTQEHYSPTSRNGTYSPFCVFMCFPWKTHESVAQEASAGVPPMIHKKQALTARSKKCTLVPQGIFVYATKNLVSL